MASFGMVYRSQHWARHLAKGRPIRKVSGGWMICRYSKRHHRRKLHRLSRLRKRPPLGHIQPIFIINFERKDKTMSKEKPIEGQAEQDWTKWFQRTKHENPKGCLIFVNVLNDFVEAHPDIAKYLTLETMHAVLLDEI